MPRHDVRVTPTDSHSTGGATLAISCCGDISPISGSPSRVTSCSCVRLTPLAAVPPPRRPHDVGRRAQGCRPRRGRRHRPAAGPADEDVAARVAALAVRHRCVRRGVREGRGGGGSTPRRRALWRRSPRGAAALLCGGVGEGCVRGAIGAGARRVAHVRRRRRPLPKGGRPRAARGGSCVGGCAVQINHDSSPCASWSAARHHRGSPLAKRAQCSTPEGGRAGRRLLRCALLGRREDARALSG